MAEVFAIFLAIVIIAIHFCFREKRKKLGALLSVMLITTSLSLFFISIEDKGYHHLYSLSVEPDGQGRFELEVPLAAGDNERPHELMYQVKVQSGSPAFERVNSTHGPALRISADSAFVLRSETGRQETALFRVSWNSPDGPHPSMYNNSERRDRFYWIYCNNPENSSLKINIICTGSQNYAGGALIEIPFWGGGHSETYVINGTINENGWQLMKGSVRMVVAN